jgi:hypothetical protein
MYQMCRHCEETIIGDAYRVTSEHEGITLLDLIVCSPCSIEAQKLGLHTEQVDIRGKQLLTQERRSHRYSVGM